MDKPKVLLIGWDAADWKIIKKLVDRGEMPNMKMMIEEGTMGNLSTLTPALSPMLWTSIATGMYADKHGIHGFSEPSADNSYIQPISVASRKVKAIWNILNQNEYKSHVINWWPSHPAEPIKGIYVSNLFPKVKDINNYDENVPANCIHPNELHELVAHLRMHPLELDLASIVPFIPKAKNVGLNLNKKVLNLMKSVAEAASVQNAATFAIQNEEWDFTAVYWDTIDHICHSFMSYYPPKLDSVKQTDFELYNEVVDGIYRLMDLMLGRLMQLAGDNATVIIVSDHGFHSDHLRPLHIPNEPAGPIYQHRQLGVFCAKGPNIKKDHVIYGASLIDVAPTILSIFNLPLGDDMDGKPLTGIFEQPNTPRYIKSWDLVKGDDGTIPDYLKTNDSEYAHEAIKQLVDLGYIENPESNLQKAIENTIEELRYNLALVYHSTNRKSMAEPLLKQLYDKYPYKGRFVFRLIDSYIQKRDFEKAHDVLNTFQKSAKEKILTDEQIKTIQHKKTPIILTPAEKENWKRDNITTPIRESKQALYDLKQSCIVEANLLIYEGKPKKAISVLDGISTGVVKNHNYYYQMASAYAKLGKWRESAPLFQKVIDSDPENSLALTGLGYAYYADGNYNDALELTLSAIEINFYNSLSHFNLGQIFEALKEYQNAAHAYEASLKIAPGNGQARNKVISLYVNHLNETERAQLHKEMLRSADGNTEVGEGLFNIKDFTIKQKSVTSNKTDIIVVSGLPRSGTSMVMQMLHAAGVPVFADNERQADKSNPKGFFEHQKTRQLLRNSKWLNEATGKAIKIVIPLLFNLPANFNYKIIIVLRDLHEVIDSQQKMLARGGKTTNAYPAGLEMTYAKYMDKLSHWIDKNHNCEVLLLKHRDIINNPESEAKKIISFLQLETSSKKIAQVIEKKLYRSKMI
ncbi:MAG: alkaline phosphatase family protein [Prolixibacteraceae bacterium]|nr:alkaline phosphatase family protein [Prolixibacteraceae bacterium]MBN2649795.1 alkaline phosphatase family protein [Prolixibacteraceae bacterium]